MRLRDLQLIRFGHFSDLPLDFTTGNKRFHVIYGHNEAGKSTALRAISGLLFGIPERTQDAHLHAAKDLRIGAELENSAGKRLEIVRRKGRKDTLLGADGSPIAEARLEAYLGGMPRELFEAMFGLDHERLIAGGRELLAGRGELGEALFGAAAGLRGLHELVEALQTEAADLFKPSGQLPRLNKALAQHREARARIKERALKPSEWEKIWRERNEAREELQRVRREHAHTKTRLEGHRVLHTALPDLRGREAILARRDEMGDVVILPDDAGERRQNAEATLKTANLRAEKLGDEKRRLEAELANLHVPDDLLALESRATDLNDRRAVYVKAARDRQDLHSKLGAGSAEVQALVRELPHPRSLDEIECLRIDAASQVRIRELAREGERCQTRVTTLHENAQAAAQRAEEAQAALAALPPERDATALQSAVDAARRDGDLEERRRRIAADLARKQEQARRETDALPLWTGSAETAIALPLPPDETVDRFEQELSQVAEEQRALDERRRTVRQELDELHRTLAELESGGTIPSPDDLKETRGQRDGLWARVRRVWLDDITDAIAPDALAGEYEDAVVQTDALGDHMFSEHERVARITTLHDLERRAEENAASIEREIEELGQREARLAEAWTAAWAPSGIRPSPPREMRAWKAQHQGVVGLMRQIGDLQAEDDTLGLSIKAHRSACLSSLADLDGPALDASTGLAAILEAADHAIQTFDHSREERGRQKDAAEAAAREKDRCDRDLSTTEQEFEEWRQRWRATIAPLDLPEAAQPAEAEAVLEKLDQIFSKHAQLNTFRERVRHIDEDSVAFVSALEELVRDGCPDLPDLAPEDRSAELLARLQQGRDHRTKRVSMRARSNEIDAELQEIGRDHQAAESEIETLMKKAALSSADELEAAERRSAEMRDLDARLIEIEERLRRTGRPLEELVAQGADVQEEDLILEIDQLEQSVEASEQQRDDQNQKLAGLERDFDAMDGGAAAAEAAAEAEEALAQIAHLAVEYAQKRMAAVVLSREIQRFAKENQGPILTRTSELFLHMTLERYEGITSGFSDDDEAILLCRRAGGKTVGVEGLSGGTRDQLYLSLRLAALEHHMVQNEPMPLIVDDILVSFDDPRSAATLKLMGELAVESQILFFTHHQRLVELAREVIPEDRLAVHELECA